MDIIIVIHNVENMLEAFSSKRAFKIWMKREHLKFQEYTYQGEHQVSEYSLVDVNTEIDSGEAVYSVKYDIPLLGVKDIITEENHVVG